MSIPNLQLKLSNSLLALLDHHKFKDITTDMICSHANVSRSTFYRNFNDKQELLLWEIDNHLDTIVSLLPESTSFRNYYIFNFTFMHSRQDYFRKLIKVNGQNSFEDYLFNKIVSHLKGQLLAVSENNTIDIKTDYLLEIFARGAVFADVKWIESGFKESPEEMTDILCTSMPECLRQYFLKE